jgi:hypothetical protein
LEDPVGESKIHNSTEPILKFQITEYLWLLSAGFDTADRQKPSSGKILFGQLLAKGGVG